MEQDSLKFFILHTLSFSSVKLSTVLNLGLPPSVRPCNDKHSSHKWIGTQNGVQY